MLNGEVAGATRILGAPKSWDAERQGSCAALAVRDEMTAAGQGMTSAWFPTPDEIERLLAGAPVYLTVLGEQHPPVMLQVGEPAEAVGERWPAAHRVSA